MIFVNKNRSHDFHYQEQYIRAMRKKPLLERLIATTNLFMNNRQITTEIATAVRDETQQLVNQMSKGVVLQNIVSNLFRLDPTLENHVTSVCILATALGQECVSKEQLLEIAEAAIYHDIGKLKTPKNILNKATSLTPDEKKIIQQHSGDGELELRTMFLIGMPVFETSARVALEHHERCDGSGYPHNKKGMDGKYAGGIHLYSHIVSIADVASALLMQRSYKNKLSMGQVIDIMDLIPLDPSLYAVFRKMILKSE